MTCLGVRQERGIPELDPCDLIFLAVRCRLHEHPYDWEAWFDSRIVGLPLDRIAANAPHLQDDGVGVTRQCVSLRARNCERVIAATLGIEPVVREAA